MPAFGSRILRFASGLLTALALGVPAFAQTEQPPPVPMPLPVPTPPELPKVPATDPPVIQLNTPSTDILTSPIGLPPLPGSLGDDYATEIADREKFRTTTWRGGVIKEFPNSLLWEPAMAVRRDPRLQFLYINNPKYPEDNLDTSIGGTMGLFRAQIDGADLAYQLDMFGVVQTRLGARDFMAADYRFGIPLTWQRGEWQGKIGYEHTSAHLGDKFEARTDRLLAFNAKDELVMGLGRIMYNQLRVYGHLAYAFNQQLPDPNNTIDRVINLDNTTQNRSRADIGFEWFDRKATGFGGTPFVAADFEVRGDQNWSPNFRAQAGWLFRNPTQRMGNARLFVEYFTGHIPYGQFYLEKETYLAAGFGFDY
jgi:hypothetical protein